MLSPDQSLPNPLSTLGQKQELDSSARRELACQHSGRDHLGVVENQQIPVAKQLPYIPESSVLDLSGGATKDQEPRRIPWLGRGLSDQLLGKIVIEFRKTHSTHGLGR
jgi:hypothetical protein